MKKVIIIICCSVFAVLVTLGTIFFLTNRNETPTDTVVENTLKELPAPEITGGSRGELGIDKNINESTIDEYLDREDSVYRDMRMLEDPGNYEAIGGDRFLSGYVDGFEVIPLPYIIPVTGLPNEVGDTYTGTTLFYDDNGTYVANYEESMSIIENIFPKDKVIFLMCGGGGYAGMTKNFLVSLGWDENKIYNVGGYWYYEGNHNVNVKKEVNGAISYDFDNVPYHNIEFNKLTKADNYKAPVIKVTELKINTSKLNLEEGTSFKLNAIALPNEAQNKEVKWSSSNESVATVSKEGLVKAIKDGSATITATAVSGDVTISCNVTVTKKVKSNFVQLDDISEEAKEFNLNDPLKIDEEFYKLTQLKQDSNGNYIPNKYHDYGENGYYVANALFDEEYDRTLKKIDQATSNRANILNKLVDDKKSFIIFYKADECVAKEQEYSSLYDDAKEILDQNNIPYLTVYYGGIIFDKTFEKSKLNDGYDWNGAPILIIKDGAVYASADPNVVSLKSREETENWLSKYIDIK